MFKVKYRDGTEEDIEAEEWELYDEVLIRFLDEKSKEICVINLDIIAKIE